MTPDIEKYRKYVSHFDCSEEYKEELIHTVWQIMESFVDRAFGIDPVQQAVGVSVLKDEIDSANMIEWTGNLKKQTPLAHDFERSVRIPPK